MGGSHRVLWGGARLLLCGNHQRPPPDTANLSYRSSRQVLRVYSEIQSFIPFRNARGSILYTVLYVSFFQLKGCPNAYHVTG